MNSIDKKNNLSDILKRTGFFSVFLSNALSKALSFFGGIVIVRILSKGDYGLYTYVMNCYSMLFLLNDFGCNVAMMQFRSEHYKEPVLFNEYFTFPFKCAILFSSLAAVLLWLSPFFFPFRQDGGEELTRALCLLPFLTTANTFLLSNLRVEMQNGRFAILNFFQVVVHYGFILPFSFFWKVSGAIFSNYAVAISMLLISLAISKGHIKFDWRSHTLSKENKRSFLRYAFASQINNSIGALLNLFDMFLIGMVIADSEVISSYKVASAIPQALMFIPNSILIYAAPLFARNVNNKDWVRCNFNRMVLGCVGINGILTCLCIGVAQNLIPLIFGKEYVDAVSCFIILMISFFAQGTFQIPAANIIYTQHKVRVNLIITIVSGAVNCILDVILIKVYGSIGAAIATLAVSVIASAMAYAYMRFWLKKGYG